MMPTTAGCGWLGARGPSGAGARGALYRASATSAARFRRSSCEDKSGHGRGSSGRREAGSTRPSAGRRAEAPYLVAAGHSVQGLCQVGRPLQQHFLGAGEETADGGAARAGVAVVREARSYLFPPYPPSGHRPPSSLPRPFEYLGQPLGVSGVSGNNFLQPLESVVNGGLIQGWGKGWCLQDAPPRIAPTSKQSPSLDAEPLLRAQPRPLGKL